MAGHREDGEEESLRQWEIGKGGEEDLAGLGCGMREEGRLENCAQFERYFDCMPLTSSTRT